MHDATTNGMGPKQECILSKCKSLVPDFDPKETIHVFCGARAKIDRGGWIMEPSKANQRVIHVVGVNSPGLAGSPAIALEAVRLSRAAGLDAPPNPNFNPNRAAIITPKHVGMKGLKMGPVGKNDSDGKDEAKMASNVTHKCTRATEVEVVRALQRSQAIRKRTRAGMGHCQGGPDNYNCEARVKAIAGESLENIGGRPWPVTSILTRRWIDNNEKEELVKRKMAS